MTQLFDKTNTSFLSDVRAVTRNEIMFTNITILNHLPTINAYDLAHKNDNNKKLAFCVGSSKMEATF